MFSVVAAWAPSPKFTKAHVERWARNFQRFGYYPYLLTTETDVPYGVSVLHPPKSYPIWWSKMPSFGLDFPHLLVDLDTRITREIPKFDKDGLIMLRDMRYPNVPASGILWNPGGDFSHNVYREFEANADAIMLNYTQLPDRFGDQGFIADMAKKEGVDIRFWQDELPCQFYCPSADCSRGPWDGETFVFLSGDTNLNVLDNPEAPWNYTRM